MTGWTAMRGWSGMKGWCRGAIAATIGVPLAVALSQPSFAHEPGDFGQNLRGVTIGVPVAAAPPPGIYFFNSTMAGIDNKGYGQDARLGVYSWIETPGLVFSPGWNLFGANVYMTVAQPMFVVDLYGPGLPLGNAFGPPFTGATVYPTIHNTYVNPLSLSWNLGAGWFIATGLSFYAPDGTKDRNTLNPDYWTFEPNIAISYLANGWNLTANFIYDFNSSSSGHTGPFGGTPFAPFGAGYTSGDQAYLDLTATKKFGKWELGPVAYFKWQTTGDKPGNGFTCAQMRAASPFTCGDQSDIALGALVGYDFGPVNLQTYFTQSVSTKDEIGGFSAWARVSFRLWAPDQPAPAKPLIHK